MKTPLVSIIMPIYNAGPFLKSAIACILNQTYSNLELVVGDDGSTDNSWEIISTFNDRRIVKHRFDENIGNLLVCNFLFSKCKGDYIGIQDADDWCDLDKIEKQVDYLNANSTVSLVGTAYAIGSEEGNVLSRHPYSLDHENIVEFILSNQYLPFHCASILVRKGILKHVGLYRTYFDRIGAADFDWIYRIAADYKLGLISDTYYYYRSNQQSFTNSFNTDLKRKFSENIAFFLFQQRLNSGIDSLQNNDKETVEQYFEKLTDPYIKNKGLIYSDFAWDFIRKQKFSYSLKLVLKSIFKEPFVMANYISILKISKFIFWKKYLS